MIQLPNIYSLSSTVNTCPLKFCDVSMATFTIIFENSANFSCGIFYNEINCSNLYSGELNVLTNKKIQ